MGKSSQQTFKRVNKKLKRVLKRREIERQKKTGDESFYQGPRHFRDPV